MALNLPTFYKRTGSAIVFAAIMLTGLLWKNDLGFLGLMCVVEVLCLRDYFRLMQKINPDSYWPKWVPVAMQLFGLIFFLLIFLGTFNFFSVGYVMLTITALLFVVPVSFLLAGALSEKTALNSIIQSFGGLLYITLPTILLCELRLQDLILPVALILMIWSNDTFAYLVGSFIGKHSFSPISPNKTWEGVIGGALLTIVGAGIYGYFAHSYRLIDWMAFAFCATVAGTLGDLLESKLKRIAGVKDSGTLMPGHGGALDRFDSLLVAAPFAYVYAAYFMH